MSLDLGVRDQRVVVSFRWEEHRLNAIVIFLRDGIEFVIVATRASDSHSEEGAGRGRDNVVHLVHAGDFGLDILLRTKAQESSRKQRILPSISQFISGDLFADEP